MSELEVFMEALLLTEPAGRAAFLDRVCQTDPPMRERIERLLALHENNPSLLNRRPADLLGSQGRQPKDAEHAGAQLAPFLAASERPGALGRLGHYDVLEVLGQGGFGIVVKAFDTALHRVVAVKVLTPALAATSPPRQRFLREARAAAQVKHENVVQIYAVEEKPLPYLVMEFVEGRTLQQQLDVAGPLAAAEVVRLGRQIALGLAAAHARGLIHRDIKPANILLEQGVEPLAKLTDFGLARAADDASLTQSGVIAGTPMYMAPEQARGEVLDARADLFSLGSVLYTMTAGRPPFRAATALAVLERVANDEPRPLREVIGEVPPALVAVIKRLLAKRPDDRFATATESAQALADCLTALARPAPRRLARFGVVAGAVLLLLAVGAWLGPHVTRFLRPEREAGLNSNNSEATAAPVVGDLVVTSTLDDGSPGTLRWAVTEANVRNGENTITFDPTVFAAPRTVALTRGPLVLIDPDQTTIIGPPAGLTISGNDRGQVFVIGAKDMGGIPARAQMTDLTIARGRTTDEIQIGGGILCRGGSTLLLSGCTLCENQALHPAGGGGGVFNGGSTVILTNCTLARNEAVQGGGLKNFAGVTKVFNCTFAGNVTRGGGSGIWSGGFNRDRTEVYNSLFANSTFNDVHREQSVGVTGNYNLSRDGSAPGPNSVTNTNARLGPLGRYGGPTETFPLLTGSPALDAGDNARVPADVRTDQRGSPRIVNGTVDIGAFEAK